VVVSFIGGGNQTIQRKTTHLLQVTDKLNKNNIGFYLFSIAFDWLPITTNTT
jgi:hypothetical protein